VTLSRTNVALLGVAVLLFAALVLDRLGDEPVVVEQWTLPAIDPDEIDGFRLANAKGEFEAERVDYTWKFTDGRPLDDDLMGKVLKSFSVPIRADVKVADEVDDLAAYGLDDARRIEIEIRRGDETPIALELGDAVAGGVSFVRPAGQTDVWRARIPSRFRLERGPIDWRDPHVLDLPEGRVDTFTLHRPERSWRFVRLTESWTCMELPELLLDARLLEAMARGCGGLRAAEIVDDPPADAFAEIPLRVDVAAQDTGTHTLEFGRQTEDGKRFVRTSGQTFLIARARYETFDRTPQQLRDRTVVRADWREVERVVVQKGSRRFVVSAIGEKQWQLDEPQGYSIDLRQMGFSVEAMMHLRGFDLDDDTDRAASGVDAHDALWFTIERWESPPITVRVSPQRGDVHHVRRDDRDQTYTLRHASAKSLVKGFGLDFE